MNQKEAREYLHTKLEVAKLMSREERRVFFIEEEAATREARTAYMNGRVAQSLGGVSVEETLSSQETYSTEEKLGPEREESEEFDEAQAIEWAQAIFEEFKDVSKDKSRKQKALKDREFAQGKLKSTKRKKSVLHHPRFFLTAMDVWRAKSLEGIGRATQLVDAMAEQAIENTREYWHGFNNITLTELIEVGASDRLSAGIASSLLRSYFEGPRSTNDKVQANYVLAHCVLDLAKADQRSFSYAALIGGYATDIISWGSDFHLDVFVATRMSVDNLQLLEKARAAELSLERAYFLAHNPTSSQQEKDKMSPSKNPRLLQKINSKGAQLREKLCDNPELYTMLEELTRYDTGYYEEPPEYNPGRVEDLLEKETALLPQWIMQTILYSLDPLKVKYDTTIGSRSNTLTAARTIGNIQDGYKVNRVEHITFPNNVIVDIYMPSGMLPAEERSLIESLIEYSSSEFRDPDHQVKLETHIVGKEPMLHLRQLEFSGRKIWYGYRISSELDKKDAHKLNQLLWVGFPFAEAQTDDEVIQALVEVQDDIEKYQHRFFNQRGVRINFDPSTQLGLRGYTHIVFKEDKTKPQNVIVQLGHRRESYQYQVDSNFNLVLDGKTISSSRFRNQIHYSTLLLMRDYVCGIVMDTEEGELTITSSGPAARIDYLRYLPEGQNFTPYASKNYLERRKKDLRTKSEERKRVDPLGRNSTYVKEIEQTDPTLPPLIVHVNPDDFLYHKIIANGFKLPPDLE